MTARVVITLRSPIQSQSPDRVKARSMVTNCLPGTRIEFHAPRRSIDQNARLWAMLGDVAKAKPNGRDYDPDDWKCLFMAAWRKEFRVLPSLDGRSLVPIYRSSELSKTEMADLQEFISAWCAENGVTLQEMH